MSRNRKKVKRNPHKRKRFGLQSVNTGPAPLWRTELYTLPGKDVRALCQETTDYRKVNPVWVDPKWDVERKSHHKCKPSKTDIRQRLHRLVVEETIRIKITMCCLADGYWCERENKVTKRRAKSQVFWSLAALEEAYELNELLWFKDGVADDDSEIQVRTS